MPALQTGWWMVGGGGVVVAILVGCLLLFGRGGGLPDEDRPQIAAEPARVTAGVALEWEDPADSPAAGQPLRIGRHRLAIGIAEVTFGNGAVAVVEAPADFEVLGPDRAAVHSGQVVVRAEDIARGFVLDTAKTEIVDLGTEFGVKVNRSNATEVHVFEGSVIARPKGGQRGTEQLLKAGQALRYGAAADAQPQASSSAPERFVRRLPGEAANPARKIPLNVSRYDSLHVTPAPAQVVIDGDLSEWKEDAEFRATCKSPYNQSHFVEGRMMYDDEFLYIAAHVGDPAPMRNILDPRTDADRAWCGGAVQVRVSTDRARGWPLRAEAPWQIRGRRAVRPEDISDRLAHLTLWYYAPEKRACLHVNYGLDLHGDAVNPPGFRGAFRADPDGRGYTAEYAIPWSLFGAPAGEQPRSGDVLATSWNVHWSNGSGRLWQGHLIEIFNPKESGWTFLRAATWGKAIYE